MQGGQAAVAAADGGADGIDDDEDDDTSTLVDAESLFNLPKTVPEDEDEA